MLTEECHLNPYLEERGIEVVDTDLGERIVQFRHEPPIHIACMGVEKVIPGPEQLPVFLRLLARSATGQSITSYTSHYQGPRPGGELHIVIVDGIRSKVLARPEYRGALRCIRCAACMNTCPVYRRSGGHSYGTTVPGPIGAVLAPHIDPARNATLPFASSLCGSCSDVCPVRIDLHGQLLSWRGELTRLGLVPFSKRALAGVGEAVLRRPWLYRLAGRLASFALRYFPRFLLVNRFNTWTIGRELPAGTPESFQEQWARRAPSSPKQEKRP
jgi:L-lactate dehydrogenase complex protein LldF